MSPANAKTTAPSRFPRIAHLPGSVGTEDDERLSAWPESRDRAQQFGRLRAWAGEHYGALSTLLGRGHVLYGGKLAGPEALHALSTTSAFGDVVMEGLIVRHERDGALRQHAKWVRPDFVRKPDDAWDLRAVNAVVGAGG